jgi:hypothetical protein
LNVGLSNVGPYDGPRDGSAEISGQVPETPNPGSTLMDALLIPADEHDDEPHFDEQEEDLYADTW